MFVLKKFINLGISMNFKNSAKFLTIMSLSVFTSMASAQDKPTDAAPKVTKPSSPEELKLLQLIKVKLEENELLLNAAFSATLAYRLTSESGKITEAMCASARKNDLVKSSKELAQSIEESSPLLVEFGQVTTQYASEVKQRVGLKAENISRNMAIIEAGCTTKFTI
jgi:hypothetical protein